MSLVRSKLKLAYTVLVLLLMLVLSSRIIASVNENSERELKEQAELLTTAAVTRLQNEIQDYFGINRIWETVIYKNRGFVFSFERITQSIIERHQALHSISLAPGGRVNFHYPADRDDDLLDVNLLESPGYDIKARYSRQERSELCDGPVKLPDGNLGIEILDPVFVDNLEGDNDFWGFVLLRLRLDTLFERSELGQLSSSGYDYELWYRDLEKNDHQTILSSRHEPLTDPVGRCFKITHTPWYIDIAPMQGWVPVARLVEEWVLFGVLSVLTAVAAYLFMSVRERQIKLVYLSHIDNLTGLYNLRKYLEILEEFDQRRLPFGILFLDLNGFKQVNDTYGHHAGDILLQAVSGRLKNSVKMTDLCFRFGGDEFAVVIRGSHETEVYDEIIARLHRRVEIPVNIGNDEQIIPSISIGYARYPEDGTSGQAVANRADDLMYEAKRNYHEHHEQESREQPCV